MKKNKGRYHNCWDCGKEFRTKNCPECGWSSTKTFKKMNNRAEGGSGFAWFMLIIIIILLFGWLYFKYTDAEFKAPDLNLDKLTESKQEHVRIIQVPDHAREWCVPQQFALTQEQTNVRSNKILGWDNINNCCVQEIEGISSSLNQSVELRYCFTGTIGGDIKYVTTNGYYIEDPSEYQNIIDDLHQVFIPVANSIAEVYPTAIR